MNWFVASLVNKKGDSEKGKLFPPQFCRAWVGLGVSSLDLIGLGERFIGDRPELPTLSNGQAGPRRLPPGHSLRYFPAERRHDIHDH